MKDILKRVQDKLDTLYSSHEDNLLARAPTKFILPFRVSRVGGYTASVIDFKDVQSLSIKNIDSDSAPITLEVMESDYQMLKRVTDLDIIVEFLVRYLCYCGSNVPELLKGLSI